MAETVANLLDLLKEVWTDDRLNRQFYSKTTWLDKVEKTNKYTIGRQAQVPVETSLPGGSTTHTAAGGALNAADSLHVDRADYTISYEYQNVEIELAALNQADSAAHTTVDAHDQTIVSNVDAMRYGLCRQLVGNQDALIAATTGTATSSEIELSASGYGFDAIERGWLRPGVTVDIGTAANETSAAADRKITAVEESTSTPSITVDGAAVTLAGSEFVSIANARSGATSKEMNGLRQIAGSSTSAVGTLDPDTAGQEFWKPAHVDTSTTLVSMALMLTLQRKVFQKAGEFPTYFTTSAYQAAELYSQYQNQVRFNTDDPKAGNSHSFEWNGLKIEVDPHIPNRELYLLTLEDFCVVTGGKFGKPTWVSSLAGQSPISTWKQGYTSVVDALVYPLQLAVKRRNRNAAAIGLTA